DPHDAPGGVGEGDRQRDVRVSHPEIEDLLLGKDEEHAAVFLELAAEHEPAAARRGRRGDLDRHPLVADVDRGGRKIRRDSVPARAAGERKEGDASRPTRSEAKPSEGRQPERERIASAKARQKTGHRYAGSSSASPQSGHSVASGAAAAPQAGQPSTTEPPSG